MKKIITLIASVSLLAGCQQLGDSYGNNSSTYKGAGLGALIGAGLGSLTGDGSTERRQRATVGAAVGALAGLGIGQYMDRQEDQMRDTLAGSGVSVERRGNDLLLNMPDSITFNVNSSVVQPQFTQTLREVATVLNEYDRTLVEVAGHTDSTGSAAHNQELSENRALAVSSRLRQLGVSSGRLNIRAYGESQPIASNNTVEGKSQNRRVEIVISPIAE